MSKELTPQDEGRLLSELLGDRNRAQFARDFGVPGGGSMISQNVSGNRPISLDGAMAYARGLGVPISAFSPRIASQLKKASEANDEQGIVKVSGFTSSDEPALMAAAAAGNTSKRAPVIAWARLGDVVFEEVINKADSLAFAPIGDHGDRVILVPIADDALAPRLRIGDMVAIDLDNKRPDRDQVTLFMAKADGAFFLRRYQPLIAPHFEAIDAKNGALDSQRHGLEVIGVRCGVRLADI